MPRFRAESRCRSIRFSQSARRAGAGDRNSRFRARRPRAGDRNSMAKIARFTTEDEVSTTGAHDFAREAGISRPAVVSPGRGVVNSGRGDANSGRGDANSGRGDAHPHAWSCELRAWSALSQALHTLRPSPKMRSPPLLFGTAAIPILSPGTDVRCPASGRPACVKPPFNRAAGACVFPLGVVIFEPGAGNSKVGVHNSSRRVRRSEVGDGHLQARRCELFSTGGRSGTMRAAPAETRLLAVATECGAPASAAAREDRAGYVRSRACPRPAPSTILDDAVKSAP